MPIVLDPALSMYNYGQKINVSGLTNGKPINLNIPTNTGKYWSTVITKATGATTEITMPPSTTVMTSYGGAAAGKTLKDVASQGGVIGNDSKTSVAFQFGLAIKEASPYSYGQTINVYGLVNGNPIFLNIPKNTGTYWYYKLGTATGVSPQPIILPKSTDSMTGSGASNTTLGAISSQGGVIGSGGIMTATFQFMTNTSEIKDKLLLTYGNNSMGNYSTCGGSRLILGKVLNPIKNSITNPYSTITPSTSYGQKSETYANYHNVNCTKPVTINCSLNLARVTLGTPACLYLVPMKKNTSTTYVGDSAPTYNNLIAALGSDFAQAQDEWGFGYNDAQGFGTGSSVEIDCIEATACSFAVTLHGIYNSTYDKPGVWCNVHNNKTPTDATPYNGQNCSLVTIIAGKTTTYDSKNRTSILTTYGPSTNFAINTLETFQVKTVITPNGDIIKMVVTLTQGTNKLILTVQSGGFPPTEKLSTMNVVISYWAQTPTKDESGNFTLEGSTTWWLDGYKTTDGVNDIRGWGKYNDQGNVTTDSKITSLNSIYQKYNNYAIPVQTCISSQDTSNAKKYNPSAFIIGNLSIEDGATGSATVLYGWIQDLMYRGIDDNGAASNWTGRYKSGYGVCYKSDSTMTLSNNFFPLPTDTTRLSAYNNYQATTYDSTSGYNFGTKVGMNPVMNKELYGFKNQLNYTKYDDMAKNGLNFFDAPGIKINGIQFKI